ncbi:MAG: hypothetical protein ABIG03_05215 [Candidatus Eisenbacteria bacterium]
MTHERDERWVYVALAVLAVAYVVYKYRTSLELPDINFRGFGKVASTLPYLAATFFGVFFQMLNRKKQVAARKRMEEGLSMEGALRRSEAVPVRVGRKRGQSYVADVFLTRAALYVFDSARKRDAMRVPTQRGVEALYIENASLEPDAAGGAPTLTVQLGGSTGSALTFTLPDAVAWWMDIRGALGKSTDVEAELAGRREEALHEY